MAWAAFGLLAGPSVCTAGTAGYQQGDSDMRACGPARTLSNQINKLSFSKSPRTSLKIRESRA